LSVAVRHRGECRDGNDCIGDEALRAGGGEEADGALRVVLLVGDGRQGLGVVGGACFVSGLGRDG
jgi:hypothetical protein